MGDWAELCADFLDALKSLASSVNFLFSGLSFGLIPSVQDVEKQEDNMQFIVILSHASQALCTLYLLVMLIIAMYFDFNSIYNIIILSISLTLAVWFIYLIKQRKKDESIDENGISGFPYFIYYASTLILYTRTLVTSYFLIQRILNDDRSGDYLFEVFSLSFNFFFLLLFTLVLYLPLIVVDEIKKEGKNILSVWSMEYADIIAHLAVCLSYAASLKASDNNANGPFFNEYLGAYFVIYVINVSLFTLPTPYVANYVDSYHPMIIHTMILDFTTDLPFTIVTLAGKTYVRNFFITIDIVVNIITFIRGIIWIPIKFKHAELNPKQIGKYVAIGALPVLGGLLAIGVSILLIFTGFDTDTSICNDGTGVNVEWATWCHVAGWILWVWIMMQIIGTASLVLDGKYSSGFWLPIFFCSLGFDVMYFVLGYLGVKMHDQSTELCQSTYEGKMIHVLSILFIIWSILNPIIGCCVAGFRVKDFQ